MKEVLQGLLHARVLLLTTWLVGRLTAGCCVDLLCLCTGWETESAFYRAMMKGGRNNMAILAVLGLMAIPTVAAGVAIVQR
jgi:hypothetical protein